MNKHCCVRVYNCGNRVILWQTPEETKAWLECNSVYRFGCALFVDSEPKYFGYLGEERCGELSKALAIEFADVKPHATMRAPGR